MKRWLALLAVLTLVFEGDLGGSSFYRRYQHVTIAPYTLSEGTIVYFQFANTYGDGITLTWRLSNTKYQQVLIYTQAFQPTTLIQKHLLIPAHIFDGGPAQLVMEASRQGFQSEVWLTLYPLQTYTIQQFDRRFLSGETITYIDGNGILRYQREVIEFTNMGSSQWHPFYGRFDWTPVTIRIRSLLSKEIVFQYANLEMGDHPSLEGLPLVGHKRVVPLVVSLVGQFLQLQFSQLYVHPQTLRMSSIPVADYVPTKTMFFPLEAYRQLREWPLVLKLGFQHFHTMHLTYAFTYQGEGPLLGHCWQSQYCVSTYA